MRRALRRHRNDTRGTERLRLQAALRIVTLDGAPAAPLARCVEIGLGGLRAVAAKGLAPGERVHVAVRLPSGRVFEIDGRVAWSRQTLHPRLFGSPRGRDDDADFGIAFDVAAPEEMLPIARLFTTRDRERQRARRIGRLHGLPIRA